MYRKVQTVNIKVDRRIINLRVEIPSKVNVPLNESLVSIVSVLYSPHLLSIPHHNNIIT